MNATALARKWRPKQFSELVGQVHVMQALSNALDQQRLHHAYLFTGTRGVGKTTIARIFAKALNCEQGIGSTPCGQCSVCQSVDQGRFVDLIEVDAASKTKVEDTRELLDNVQYAPAQGRYKVYLIDEVHMLSKSSFNALLKTLEEPPEHVKFLLATTDPHKLPATVLSRCLQFNLMRLTPTQISQHLSHILQQEGVPFEDAAIAMVAKSADGSARDSLSLLDQAIAYGAGQVMADAVKAMLGLVDQQFTQRLLQALAAQSAQQIKQVMQELAQMGIDYEALMAQLIEALHQLSLLQLLQSVHESPVVDEAVLTELAQALSAEQVQAWYQIALLGQQDMRLAPDVRIGFEMALLRMLAFEPLAHSAPSMPLPPQEEVPPTKKPSAPERGEPSPSSPQQTRLTRPTNPEPPPGATVEAVAPAPSTLSTPSPQPEVSETAATERQPQPASDSQATTVSAGPDKAALLALMEEGETVEPVEPTDPGTPHPLPEAAPEKPPLTSASPQGTSTQDDTLDWQADQMADWDSMAPMTDMNSMEAMESMESMNTWTTPAANPMPPENAAPEPAVKPPPQPEPAPQRASASPAATVAPRQEPDSAPVSDAQPWPVTDWEALMQQLGLNGLSAELGRHCVCLGRDARELRLSLDPESPHARSELAWMQLEEQVKAILGLKLTFVNYDGAHWTPAKAKKQQKVDRQAAAKASIEQDPTVALLKERLNVTVLENTLRPKDLPG
ncbi:DNA polymerase III subunit gamma/tau [Hydrogenovibrio halophilus]|uniref:DNA polymerase III subunit gamma/tau n=1 Tax=Hydrogenovibrio halophilus TaxID=373391 RepID=UPI00036A55C7|nr:DNA polymerase III subunit gamma/tau [Hydrogenovibrio halophilus]